MARADRSRGVGASPQATRVQLTPRAPAEPYVRLSPHTALHVPRKSPSLREPWAPPIAGRPKSHAGHVSSVAPFPLQELHHYYEPIRPCALLRYSRLVG